MSASSPLRIGINALYLIPGNVGGTEIYLRSLLQALSEIDRHNEYFLYANAETGSDLAPASPRFRFINTTIKASSRPARIFYEQAVLPFALRRDRISVLFNAGFTGPVTFGRHSVTVFHDLQHKRHPEFFRWFDLPFWNLLLGATAARSCSLIAVSQATATDLARYYPNTKDRISVVPHGVDPEFFVIAERRAHLEPYLLSVSTLHPHKNIDRLLEAFAEFRLSRPDFRLIVVGLKGFAAEQLASRRRQLGLDDSVEFTGWIPREQLYRLFEKAWAFIAPSQFEGFGMPLIEALAAGIPTACSAIDPFLSIAGEAAVRFAPDSVDQMTAAITRIVSDEDFRCRAPHAGAARGRLFDWQATARHTLDVIERAARD